MKKIIIILILLALLPISRAFAQKGEILFTDFDPDPFLYVHSAYEAMSFDLTYDSIYDLRMYFQTTGLFYVNFRIESIDEEFEISQIADGDTVPNAQYWRNVWGCPQNPDCFSYMAYRIEIDGDYYYGWFRVYSNAEERKWYFDKFAFCTIPNYPLIVGQTSLTDGIGEMETTASRLHPNPTKGTVHIEGEKAAKVQVFYALGQLLKTVQNSNEVSLEGLPQGVYVLRVTLENGKVFSDKVVKE